MSLDILGIFPDSFEEWRDLIIIIYGVMGILLMLVFVVVSVLLWFLVRGLVKSVRALLDDPVRPTLEEVQKTAANVRGTTEFIADTAVHPVIRFVAIARGVRRGVATITGLRRRGG
jgi:hypothetical protein